MRFKSSSLNTNARIYFYDTPRDTMAKDPMLQSLCSTPTWKAPRLILNTSNYLFMCSRASPSTQNISSIMCFRVHTQHIKHMYWLMPNISNKSSCSYAVGFQTQYTKLKHQSHIITNGAYAHKCQVKIQDITSKKIQFTKKYSQQFHQLTKQH